MRVNLLDQYGAVVGSTEVARLDQKFDVPVAASARVTGVYGMRLGDWVVGTDGEVGDRPAEQSLTAQLFASDGVMTIKTTFTET